MKALSFEPPLRSHKEGGEGTHGHDQDQAMKPGSGFHTHLDLSLGISSDTTTFSAATTSCRRAQDGYNGELRPRFFAAVKDDFSALHQISNKVSLEEAKSWQLPAEALHSGFIHPWSLAARQQKAVFEQAHQKQNIISPPPSYSSLPIRAALSSFSLVVGWPPLRAFRKNLGSPNSLMPESTNTNSSDQAKKPKLMEKEEEMDDAEQKTAMFVKVNMEGFAVGRKINLKAHDGYRSLLRAVCKLFHNFLSNNYLNNSEEGGDEIVDDDFILLYEDNEGDQMLVGDIPWELFVTSVKKLYIAQNPKKVAAAGRTVHEIN
ncbi:auxin-responsive protein IAA25-like isoform X1 [Canna indica]|uniref:Auxin-responsive protein n=1 Tax=Canna indica TaxID=4628 RepID=A0AAQ3KZ04_9LILI|nr:auxin-responsive protein IAA25-like isoform X1 [Canna indica]